MYRYYLCLFSLDKAAILFAQCHARDCTSSRDGLKDTAGCVQVLCRRCAIEHRALSSQGVRIHVSQIQRPSPQIRAHTSVS